ncbi:MAG: type II secretion system F family protein [Verrucomicrobiota bacterium]
MNRKKLITSFYRQLTNLLKAGFPLVRSLKILAERVSERRLRDVINGLVEHVERGNTFWEALAREPRYFPNLQVQLVCAGENSGNLVKVLEQLATMGQRDIAMRHRLRSTLAYPVLVLLVATLLISFLATTIVPIFAPLFEDARIDLPWSTRFLLSASELIRGHWVALLLGITLVVLAGRFVMAIRAVREFIDLMKLRITVLGPLTKERVVIQTCNTLGMLLRSGINLIRALELTRDASANLFVARVLKQVGEEVNAGRGLETPLRQMHILPPLVVDMIVTGQETGSLDDNLLHAAEMYEDELENKLRIFQGMAEPLLTLVIGGIVVFVALSLFLPYFQLLETMSSSAE